jgi:arginyl-tRNA synthetase
MSTLDLPGLAKILEGLGLGPIPQFSEAHLLNNPLDIGRSYLADILSRLVGCDPIPAYNSIQLPYDIYNGNLMVPLPKLCRGADWRSAFASDLIEKVRHSFPYAAHCGPD